MVTWKKAEEWLNEGKKIRLTHWTKELYWVLKNGDILRPNKKTIIQPHYITDWMDGDWEIFEDKCKHCGK